MKFSRQEYWSELSFPSLGDFPDLGIKPASPLSPALRADSLPRSHQGNPWAHRYSALNGGTQPQSATLWVRPLCHHIQWGVCVCVCVCVSLKESFLERDMCESVFNRWLGVYDMDKWWEVSRKREQDVQRHGVTNTIHRFRKYMKF